MTRGSWNTATPRGTTEATSAGPVDQPRAGDHLGEDHRDGLQRFDFDIFVPPWIGVLHRENPDGTLETNDRDAGEAVEPLLARFRLVDISRVLDGLRKVEHAALGRDRSDQPLAHPQPSHVHGFLAQSVRREQLEIIVAQEIDRADLAFHLVRDEVDDLVELGLRRSAPRHDGMEAGQDLAGGGGG
jgi:hypothetical protein